MFNYSALSENHCVTYYTCLFKEIEFDCPSRAKFYSHTDARCIQNKLSEELKKKRVIFKKLHIIN